MKPFYEHKFSIFNIIFDLLLIAATLFLHWDPARLLAFYWMDVCMQLLFYILYMRFLGYLRNPFKLIVTFCVGVGLMTTYLIWIVKLAPFTFHTNDEAILIKQLFEPYYEVSFFLVLSGLSSFHFYRKVRSSKTDRSEIEFFLMINCGLALLTIPIMMLFTTIFFALTVNITLSMIISIVVVRNRLDAWRNYNLRKFLPVKMGEVS